MKSTRVMVIQHSIGLITLTRTQFFHLQRGELNTIVLS